MFNGEINLYENLLIKHTHNSLIWSPLDLRHNLIKYEYETEMRSRFPYFFDKYDRQFYDIVYLIKTENPFYYVDAHKNKFCDTILICCKNKTYNIMFELDTRKPYYKHLPHINPQPIIANIYNNKNK